MTALNKIDELAALRLSISVLESKADKLATSIKASLARSNKLEARGSMYKAMLVHQPAKTVNVAAHDQLRTIAIGKSDAKFTPPALNDATRAALKRVSSSDAAILNACSKLEYKGGGFIGTLGESVTVYKSVKSTHGHAAMIATLVLPAGTRVVKTNGFDKMRASQAKVVSIKRKDGGTAATHAVSWYTYTFKYTVGATVKPRSPFSTRTGSQCDSGIHFYSTVAGARSQA